MSGTRRATATAPRRHQATPQQSGVDSTGGRSRGHRRKPRKRRGRALMGGTAMLLAAAAGWFTIGPGRTAPVVNTAGAPDVPQADQPSPNPSTAQAGIGRTDPPAADRSDRSDGSLAAIPGLGASFLSRVPAETRQLLVASGKGKDSSDATVTLFTRTPEGRWQAGTAWPAHNAYKGWTDDHSSGDLRSPIGVFALTDAGGHNADPGSKLPYDQSSAFVMNGTGFNGEQLAGSFNYVVAINYNRVAGSSPLDGRFPDGAAKGGGIWLHVDHGGPTHGCVTLTEDHMAELIKVLDPALHPMIAMGDAASLAA
ncbi:L,D-transpeptidase family protein [Kitasatospora sp. MAP5-34]|uniref:L,D-transpeptidase family protein n=1 Tax=Kitasatospora sp. MAP5-34 TaxID=3035102 RepID=UPI0024772A50|nr:L,D-transpeptidase family protein [Kitasatospora sp. MAP5-34]MDH6578346.1 L,D-peptidoglycan transpeptidase YkuD (ErfK/YbiS/YcfS/YnhG family) [Kitasatospora sp. MAP5-34]